MDGKTNFIRLTKEEQSVASTKYAPCSFIECIVLHYLLTEEHQKFMTEEQLMNILRDEAIFSDGPSARARAINKLAQDYETKAIPIINEIVDSLPYSEDEFRTFCKSVIEKIRYNFGEGR